MGYMRADVVRFEIWTFFSVIHYRLSLAVILNFGPIQVADNDNYKI